MESVREMHLRMQQEMQQILEDNERLRGSSAVSKHQIAEHQCPRPCCRDGEYLRLQQNEASLLQQTEQLASQLRALQQERKEQDDRLQEMEDQCQDLLERQEQLTRELEDNLPAKERAKLTRQIEALKLQNRELKEEQARLLEQQRHHTRQSEQDAACDILKLQAAELQQANEALQTRNRELEMKVELLQRQLAEERAKTNIGLLPSDSLRRLTAPSASTSVLQRNELAARPKRIANVAVNVQTLSLASGRGSQQPQLYCHHHLQEITRLSTERTPKRPSARQLIA